MIPPMTERDSYTGTPIKQPRAFPKGKYLVVDETRVAELTAAGAHVVEILPTQKLLPTLYYATCPHCNSDRVQFDHRGNNMAFLRCATCSKQGALDLSDPVIINSHNFLVLIEPDQVYEELRESVRDLLKRREEELATIRENEKRLKEIEGVSAERFQTIDELRAKVAELEKALAAARADLKGRSGGAA